MNIDSEFTDAIGTAFIEIPLTQGFTAIVDKCDADLLSQNWYATKRKNKYYARECLSSKRYLHRVILSRILGRKPLRKEEADHINGDSMDNRRKNIRLATPAQNKKNTRIRSDNTSGYKGVSFMKSRGKWRAEITVDGKYKHLGLFTTPKDAHEAYCAAAKELHGDFARFE